MAKKTKGLSFDEKKQVLARVMINDGMYYNFKEIEVLAKKNGIVPQSVKEVLDCLIAERIVTQEKIGSLNISNELTSLQNQITAAESTLCCLEDQVKSNEQTLQDLQKTNPSITEIDVAGITREISDLDSQKRELEKQLTDLVRSDPTSLKQLRSAIDQSRDLCNIWTDNIYILRQFLSNKANLTERQTNEIFGIPDEFDLL